MQEAPRFYETGPPRSGSENSQGLRMDIQGMRALAILLVVFAHSGALAGGFIGIDVFFVISGFLITGILLDERKRRGTISLRKFWARRARRLLPGAALVLLFIAGTSLLLYPPADQVSIGEQIVGAVFYFVNWIFAFQETNYFADSFLSPVMHFWSLSVEEQFYLVWPLLLLATVRYSKQTLGRILLLLIAISFAYSLYLSSTNPDMAYFSSLTRIWELGAGALLALWMPRALKMSSALASTLVAGGVVVLLICALTFNEGAPGWQALLPVLATVAILIGGTWSGQSLPSRLLSTKPMQKIGDLSYAWYLWHWPVIVFALVLEPTLSTPLLLAIGLASIVPAWISHRFVENPLRYSKKIPLRALAAGGAASVVAAASGMALAAQQPTSTDPVASSSPGAEAIRGSVPFQKSADRITPGPLEGKKDRGKLFYDGCMAWGEETTQEVCTYGNPQSDTSVVLFGDSKAMSWFPALEPIAKEKDWKLVGLTRGNCVLADVEYEKNCDLWRNRMLDRIPREKPDLVILSTATKGLYRASIAGEQLSRKDSQPLLRDGLIRIIEEIQSSGAEVVLIQDQVLAPFNPPDCLLANKSNLTRCAYPPRDRLPFAFDLEAAKATGIKLIDPLPMICSEKICPPVIGGVLVNQDNYHVTATYAATMKEWMSDRLGEAAG